LSRAWGVKTIMYGSDADFQALLRKIQRERKVDLTRYKPSFIQRRIAARLRARGVTSYRAYMYLLDEEEYLQLFDTLTINYTSFFRDTSTFQALRDQILRPLIREREQRGVRRLVMWSAGCASGEETYSLAILVSQVLGSRLSHWNIRILGTDIDENKLAQAREGIYGPLSFRGTKWPHLERYFLREGEKRRVRPDLKRLVRFQHHDLLHEEPPRRFDIILCRNVLIYFQRPQQNYILQNFHKALYPGGYLILGKTEIIPIHFASLFETINRREHIYRKKSPNSMHQKEDV